MNEQQLAAVKMALEALEKIYIAPEHLDYIANWWPACRDSIPALRQVIAQDALDKKADNARELGLSYDEEPKIGCVNHDCDKCKAVQEPVAKVDANDEGYWADILPDRTVKVGQLLYTAPQPVPVKTYHDGKPWPVAPKPWVGLTDEEVAEGLRKPFWEDAARAIEAKLKEKNT